MKKKAPIIILLSFAILFWGLASLYQILITLDIPVSFTTTEAIIVHILFSFSTLLFLFASITFRHNKIRKRMGVAFFGLFTIKLFIFINYHLGAAYFNSSYAQLEISSLLSAGILMLFNFYFVLKEATLK